MTDSRPETNINAMAVVKLVCVYYALPSDGSAARRSGPGHFSNRPLPLSGAYIPTRHIIRILRCSCRKKKYNQNTKVPNI